MRSVVCSGILVSGILLIRKFAAGKITRKLQYSLWLMLPVLLLLEPFLHFDIAVPVSDRFHVPEIMQREESARTEMQIYGRGTSFADYITTPGISFYDNNQNKPDDTVDIQKTAKMHDIWKITKYAVSSLLSIFIIIENIIFTATLFKTRKFYKKDEETGLNIYIISRGNTIFIYKRHIS